MTALATIDTQYMSHELVRSRCALVTSQILSIQRSVPDPHLGDILASTECCHQSTSVSKVGCRYERGGDVVKSVRRFA
jgi:hypothetical protein